MEPALPSLWCPLVVMSKFYNQGSLFGPRVGLKDTESRSQPGTAGQSTGANHLCQPRCERITHPTLHFHSDTHLPLPRWWTDLWVLI